MSNSQRNPEYLRVSQRYTTGFLPNDSIARIKQGLAPQNIANACAYVEPTIMVQAAMSGIPAGSLCNEQALLPFPSVQMSYGIPSVPENCPCTTYLQAP